MGDDDSHLRLLFDEHDVDNSGVLERDEVRSVAEKLFCPDSTRGVTEEELDHMMAIMDADGNGTVSFVEFENWWTSLGWEAVKMDDPDAPEPDEHDKEDHKHEVTVVLSGITKDPMHGDNTVLYAFDVKVFGVTVYKFFDRYSRLRSVHQNMKAAGCLDSFPIDFPAKSWLTDHASDANAQQTRGQQLLGYYASLFTNAQVMNHARTRELLGFDATNIDEAKAKRKDLHAKIAKEPPIAATVINFSVGDYVKILHEFDGNTYQDPDQWRAVDDLELAIGDVVVVAGKATHEEEHIEGWYRGYKVDVRDEVKNFPATPRFARLCTEAERNEALEAARSALHQKHAAEATFEPHAEAAGAGGAPKRARRKQGDNGGGGGCCASRPSD